MLFLFPTTPLSPPALIFLTPRFAPPLASLVGTPDVSKLVAFTSVPGGSTLFSVINSLLPLAPVSPIWWIAVLAAWENSENVPQQFPLLSAHSFWTDPARASVIVSDASGPDDFGYYHGPLGSESPQFGAFPWDDSYKFVNSHCGELTALWHYVERSTASSCLLLWVSDNQTAVYGVNKGTCRRPSRKKA